MDLVRVRFPWPSLLLFLPMWGILYSCFLYDSEQRFVFLWFHCIYWYLVAQVWRSFGFLIDLLGWWNWMVFGFAFGGILVVLSCRWIVKRWIRTRFLSLIFTSAREVFYMLAHISHAWLACFQALLWWLDTFVVEFIGSALLGSRMLAMHSEAPLKPCSFLYISCCSVAICLTFEEICYYFIISINGKWLRSIINLFISLIISFFFLILIFFSTLSCQKLIPTNIKNWICIKMLTLSYRK